MFKVLFPLRIRRGGTCRFEQPSAHTPSVTVCILTVKGVNEKERNTRITFNIDLS